MIDDDGSYVMTKAHFTLWVRWLIDWYLTPTLAIFHLYFGVNNFFLTTLESGELRG